MDDDTSSKLTLTASIVSAYVAKNSVPAGNLPGLILNVYESFARLRGQPEVPPPALTPAVAVKKSVTPDYIISLEDGRKLKSLKRHLSTKYGMTPDQYRAKWNLPADYPMVAPNYAATRSSLAKSMGLGRKASAQADGAEPSVANTPAAPSAGATAKAKAAATKRRRKPAAE